MNINWIKKLALADLINNRLRSAMTILSVIIITTLFSSCVIMYLSLLSSTDKMIHGDINFSVGFYVFMIIPVLICGLLLIIDCFHLNRQNSINQIGLLASIGVTRRQNRGILRWQTFYLTAPGVIISIAITLVFVYLVMPFFTDNLYSNFQTVDFTTVLLVLLCGGIVSMGLVNTGLYISYYESERMSVSEMISYNSQLSYNRKTVLSRFFSKNIITENYPRRRLNKTAIAFKAYIRNVKNNAHVLISMLLALTTLLTVSVIINGISPDAFADVYVGASDYKLINKTFSDEYVKEGSVEELFAAGQKPARKSPSVEVFNDELVSEIQNNSRINSLKIIRHLYMVNDEKYDDGSDVELQYYEGDFFVVDTEYILSRFAEGNEPDQDQIEMFEKGEIAFFPEVYDKSQKLGFDISGNVVREEAIVQAYESAMQKNGFGFTVYSIPDEISETNPYIYSAYYVHENFLEKIDIEPLILSIEFSANSEDRPEIQRWVDEKVAPYPLIKSESRDRYEAMVQNEKDAIYLVGYLLAIILVFISMLGFAIMNSVSMDIRRKEFFLLRCAGMRKRDIRSMLIIEGIIYGGGILIFMTCVANPLIWLMYNSFKTFYNTYHFTVALFIISMILTFIIVLIIPIVIYQRQTKKNL